MNIQQQASFLNDRAPRIGRVLEDVLQPDLPGDITVRVIPEPNAADMRWVEQVIDLGRSGKRGAIPVDLTPGRAAALLKRNGSNRNLKEGKIAEMADDLRFKRWEENGETIIVSLDGFLNDGQNRCWAVIDAARPMKTLIAFGVTRHSRLTIDQGTARTSADYLRMENGTAKPESSAAAAKLLLLHKRGYMQDGGRGGCAVSKALIRAEYQANAKKIDDAVARVSKGQARFRGAPTVAANVILAKRNETAADLFIDHLTLGSGGLASTDAIFVLRESLTTGKRLTPGAKLELILRHWNAWRQDKKFTGGRRLPLRGEYPEKLEF